MVVLTCSLLFCPLLSSLGRCGVEGAEVLSSEARSERLRSGGCWRRHRPLQIKVADVAEGLHCVSEGDLGKPSGDMMLTLRSEERH
jgi:hypothetical protein